MTKVDRKDSRNEEFPGSGMAPSTNEGSHELPSFLLFVQTRNILIAVTIRYSIHSCTDHQDRHVILSMTDEGEGFSYEYALRVYFVKAVSIARWIPFPDTSPMTIPIRPVSGENMS